MGLAMTILEILEVHDDYGFDPVGDSMRQVCMCGTDCGQATRNPDGVHRAHLAEVLDKHMQEREYRAWSNGFHKGRKTENGSHISTWPKNPYRKDTTNGR